VTLTLLACLLVSRQSGLIPRSKLLVQPSITFVQLSPNGRTVSYLENRVLHVRDGQDRVLTPGQSVFRYVWSPDSGSLIVQSQSTDGITLSRVKLDGSAVKLPIANPQLVYFLAVSPHQPERFAFAVNTGEDASSGLFTARLDGSDAKRISESHGFNRWFLDGKLNPVGAAVAGPEEMRLYYLTARGAWKDFAHYYPTLPALAGMVGASTDGSKLFYIGNENTDTSALQELDRATGITRVLAQDRRVDFVSASATQDPRTGSPMWAFGYWPRARRALLRKDLADHFKLLENAHKGDVSMGGVSADGQTWLIRYLNGTPIDYYLYDLRTRKSRFLFNDTPDLAHAKLSQRQGYVVASSDNRPLPVDVFLPVESDPDGDGKPNHPLPTLLYVHGGPWIGFEWNIWEVNRLFQWLTNRGYAVVRTEFRGAAGYGKKFMDLGDLEWGRKMNQDVLDIAQWAVKKGVADPKRRGICGWSYGGYEVYAALAFSPGVFACGMAMYGPADILPTDPRALGFVEFWRRRVGDPTTEEGKALLRSRSPINFVDKIQAPLFIGQGLIDDRVPPEQSDRMAAALEQAGKPVTYMVFPNEGHDLARKESWEAWCAVAEQFLKKHLGGKVQPVTNEIDAAGAKMMKVEPGLGIAKG
jgi:dipeptidyl aminopeptidase/acylaminoacyl peptidase